VRDIILIADECACAPPIAHSAKHGTDGRLGGRLTWIKDGTRIYCTVMVTGIAAGSSRAKVARNASRHPSCVGARRRINW
jgi:hypothetical protein